MRGCLLFAIVVGCGGAPHDETAYVLLDREAREAGVQIEANGWKGAPTLPTAFDAIEQVAVATPRGRSLLNLRPGSLAWIRGPEASIQWSRVGADIRSDAVLLDGRDDGARALASLLEGRLTREPDSWLLEGDDVLTRGSFMEIPGVVESRPIAVAPGASATTLQAGVQSSGLVVVEKPRIEVPPAVGDTATALVGLYQHDERTLILDAQGGFTLTVGCGTPRHGQVAVQGARVVLKADEGTQTVLILDGDSLRDMGNVRLEPVGGR
jgi:hypothetical protein